MSPGRFWGAQTHANVMKFLAQLKSQRSGSKIVCGFFIILTLKGARRFEVKDFMHFVGQKDKLNKNETESKLDNSTNNFRDTKLVLQLI